MDALKIEKCDEVRWIVIQYHDNYREKLRGNKQIDLYSAIGDWLPVFITVIGYNIT